MLNPNRYTNIAEPIPHGQHRVNKVAETIHLLNWKCDNLPLKERIEVEKMIDGLNEYLIKLNLNHKRYELPKL
jgi:hypothetical protein